MGGGGWRFSEEVPASSCSSYVGPKFGKSTLFYVKCFFFMSRKRHLPGSDVAQRGD